MRTLEKRMPRSRRTPSSNTARNDFSRWLFARTEITLASKVRPLRDADFQSVQSHRDYLVPSSARGAAGRQKGIVVNFEAGDFDLDAEFFKIGKGSLGGKARGWLSWRTCCSAQRDPRKVSGVKLGIPQSLVITTEGFDTFVADNNLKRFATRDAPDEEVAEAFRSASFPQPIADDLRAYLARVTYPLAVRSSSLLEDAKFRPTPASTAPICSQRPPEPGRAPQAAHRRIKLVYASTYFQSPKAFSRRVGHRTEEEKMAVIIQQLVGEPAAGISTRRSPGRPILQLLPLRPHEARGRDRHHRPRPGQDRHGGGKGAALLSPASAVLPQRSTVADILDNSQQFFYSLRLGGPYPALGINEDANLEKREVASVAGDPPVRSFSGYFLPRENRIRESYDKDGYAVLTFSQLLKYDLFPLAPMLADVLGLGQEGIGSPVEIEFSVNLRQCTGGPPEFALLQLRPMTARAELLQVDIREEEVRRAFCTSSQALGNGEKTEIADIVFVKPEAFDAGRTLEIAREIGSSMGGSWPSSASIC